MKNRFLKAVSALILALSLICILPGCKSDNADAGRSVQEIIEEIAVDHATYGAEAENRINELLKELEGVDSSAAARWKDIVSVWTSPELGKTINYDVLPDGLPDTDELCIVALGFQLEPDGTMRDELIERLKVVKNSAEKYPNAYIVCTGGGTAAENEDASEAGEMAKWLIENGIDKDRVIVEDNSITTAQNAIFTYDILTCLYPSVKKLAIVSSDYHIATGELLFKAEAIIRANTPGNERLEVVSNAAWKAPSGTLSTMFQAGALIELSGDIETAFEIYYDNYDIHELPPLN
ncbi:MAG: YdcF family protein [Clostridia bacterium]|nr:YdcF family protein [Clostridia bacterium]